jgi:hypothetical protein
VRNDNFRIVQQKRRVRARWVTSFAAISVASGIIAACVELKGQLGSDCLKNDDCQSGVCAQLHCVQVPPEFLFEAGVDAGADAADSAPPPPMEDAPNPTTDAPGDGPVMREATADVELDSGTPPPDATMDAIDETPGPDALPDSPPDAPSDAKADAENG